MLVNEIQTKRLLLRNLRDDDDFARYFGWLINCEITRFLEVRHNPPTSPEALTLTTRNINGRDDQILFGIFEAEHMTYIGNIKVGQICSNSKTASIGYFIGEKSFWNKGLATEAVKEASNFALRDLNLLKVTAGCHEQNIASQKCLISSGFIEEESLRSSIAFEGSITKKIVFSKQR